MSRLHTVRSTIAEIAAAFGADAAPDLVVPSDTIEGLPGLVIIERDGLRLVRSMTWGFPRPGRSLGMLEGHVERVGMVADLTNPMWDEMVVDPRYRCLIPVTHFANPDGEAGARTRTWFSVRDLPIVAWAGFCRNVSGHGPVYAGMTMEANAAIRPTNDRMPVLLEPDEQDLWLHGSIEDVIRFQYRGPVDATRMVVERTDDLWRSGKAPPGTVPSAPQLALL